MIQALINLALYSLMEAKKLIGYGIFDTMKVFLWSPKDWNNSVFFGGLIIENKGIKRYFHQFQHRIYSTDDLLEPTTRHRLLNLTEIK